MEQWLDIQGYEGYYQVSNVGRVKRMKRERNTFAGRILKPSMDKDGYRFHRLFMNGKPVSFREHRLVAFAFIGLPPKGKNQINHKDGNKINNTPENLEWCSPKENSDHKVNVLKTHARGERIKRAVMTVALVYEARKLARQGLSQRRIAKTLGVSRNCIRSILCGITWKHI